MTISPAIAVDVFKKKYQARFQEHGVSHLALGWPNAEDMQVRFGVMAGILDGAKDVLDFGCGFGDFGEYLGPTIRYSGLDIVPEFVEHVRQRFPNGTHYLQDVLQESNLPNFDCIVCNGVFTERLVLSYRQMLGYWQAVLKALWEKTNVALAFNTMSVYVDWKRRDLFHLSLDAMAKTVSKLSRHFQIRHDYHLYEYTVYVFKC